MGLGKRRPNIYRRNREERRVKMAYEKVKAFQEKYPSRADKEKALKAMSDKQIDELIADSPNIQAKVWYKSFKKNK